MRTRRAVTAVVATAFALTGLAGVVAVPPAGAVPVNPQAAFDTRGGAKPTLGSPFRRSFGAGAVISVTVTDTEESGTLSIYACAAPGIVPPQLIAYNVGDTASNLVRLSKLTDPATEFCFEPSGPAHIVATTWTPPAPHFEAITQRTVFDGAATNGGETATATITGLAGDAAGVSLIVTLPEGGSVSVYGCGTPRPSVPSVVGGPEVQSAALVELLAARTVCLYGLGSSGQFPVKITLTGQFTASGAASIDFPYVTFKGDGPIAAPGLDAVTPTRLFDTRDGGGARRGAGTVLELDLSSKAPLDGTAVLMNVTAVEGTANGFVTVYPCDIARPTASNLNYVTGQIVPNQVVVALATSAKICFYTHTAVHLIADLGGWFVLGAGNGYRALPPARVFDTRNSAGRTPVEAGGVYTLDLSEEVDPTAEAVTMNVTVTEPIADGFLTVYPCDAPRPLASNLNYARNQTVPNLVTVKLSASNTVCFYAQQRLHLLADLAGAFEPALDTGFYGLAPTRLVDTRNDPQGALPAGEVLKVTVPLLKLDAAVFNVTVTEPPGSGFVTVFPCGGTQPVVSNLNYVRNQTVPNLVTVTLDADGSACFYVQTTTHLIVDLSGVYSPDPFVDATPAQTVTAVIDGSTPVP